MLRNALDNMGMFFNKLFVALLWVVFKIGIEKILSLQKSFE